MCLNNNQKPKTGNAAEEFCCSRSRILLRRRENKPPCQHLSLASIICFQIVKSKVFCFFLSLLCDPVRNAGGSRRSSRLAFLSERNSLLSTPGWCSCSCRSSGMEEVQRRDGGGAASASSGRDRQNQHVWRSSGGMEEATWRREKRGNTKAMRIPAFVSLWLVTLVCDLPSGFSRQSCFPTEHCRGAPEQGTKPALNAGRGSCHRRISFLDSSQQQMDASLLPR